MTTTSSGVSEETLYDTDLTSETEAFNRFFQQTKGVLLSWSGGPSEYVEALAPAERDLRGARVLSFRIAQQPNHPNTVALGGAMTIRVELEDSEGARSAVDVAALDTIPEIYPAVVSGIETTSAAFKTFRIPIAAFAADGRSIELARITTVRLRMADPGCSPQGRVAVDDLEIER